MGFEGRLAVLCRKIGAWVACAFVLGSVLALSGASGTASAAGNGYWSIYPGQLANQQPRAFFNYLLDPAGTVTDSVIVTNQTKSAQKFYLYPADAFNAQGGGGFSLRTTNYHMQFVGSWVSLSNQVLTVPAKTSAIETFQVTLPKDVPPGDYAGGIVARPYSPTIQKHGGVSVGVYEAVATRVYIRVAGPLHPKVDVTKLEVHPQTTVSSLFGGPYAADVTYTFSNTGNTIVTPTALLKISPFLVGTHVTSHPHQFDSLLPGNSATVTVHYNSVWSLGELNADLTIKSKSSNGGGHNAAPVTATASGLNIPWLLILVIVLVITYWLWRRRRRRRAAGQQSPPGAGSDLPPEAVSAGARETVGAGEE